MERSNFKCRLIIIASVVAIMLLLLISIVCIVIVLNQPDEPKKKEVYRTGAVAADVGRCSDVGVAILKQNGSAVDAAIASLFCIGASNIQSSGIGGGLFMVVYINKTGSSWAYNGREKAPGNASRDMFVNKTGSSNTGALAIAVPGELKAMYTAWKEHGRMPWKNLVQPAIKLCKKGFPLHKTLYTIMNKRKDALFKDPGFRNIFFNDNGKMLELNDNLTNPELGETLEKVANDPTSFYTGPMASKIAQDIQRLGGIITEEDMRKYDVKSEKAMRVSLDETSTIFTSPPPSSGPVLAMIIMILKGFNFIPEDESGDMNSIKSHHRIIEAFKFAYAYRALLGDPDYENQVNQVVQNMTSDAFTESLRQKIFDNMTHDVSYYGGFYSDWNDGGTTHLSVVSKEGDAVAVTSTINTWFGSKVRSPSLGIVYNNEMDDFSTPGLTNIFGVEPSPRNYIKPGKRMMSSMSPTIVVDKSGRVRLVIGASGGTRITTAVAQVLMNYMWFGKSLKAAITAPRVHHQLVPTYIRVEKVAKYTLKQSILDGLKNLGHTYRLFTTSSSVQAVDVDERGEIHAMSDPRKNGRAAGY